MHKRVKNKINRNGRKVLLVSILCLFGFCLAAQSQANKNRSKQKNTSKVYLLHSNLLKKSKNLPDVQVLVGDVVFRHDSVYMYCDSALIYEKSKKNKSYTFFSKEF